MERLDTPSTTLDIILPSYRPNQGWESRIIEMHQFTLVRYPHLLINWILVDDGSNYDYRNALAQLQELNIPISFLRHEQNMGKGQALRTGCKQSKAEIIIYTDIDFPYEFDSFTRILDALIDRKADLVYGVRSSDYFLNIPSQRRFISGIVKKMNQFLFKLPSPDTQCGLKGFMSCLRNEFLATKTKRYLIDLEFLHRIAKKKAYKLLPLKVKLYEETKLGKLKLSSLISEISDYFKILFVY